MISLATRTCNECPLGEWSDLLTNCMPGNGPVVPDILFVGEAPGAEEDKSGKPFQGRAGKKLKECEVKAGLTGYPIRYTNTNRCRPINNSKPSPSDSEACRHYLLEEIEMTKPKVIVLGGNIAMRLLGSGYRSVTKERGQVIDWNGYKVVITVHPAYVLRKWEDEVLLVSDLKLAKSVVDGTYDNTEKRDYRVVKTIPALEALVTRLENAKEFAFDIESRSFDWRSDPLLCVGFADKPGEAFVVPVVGQNLSTIWTPEEYPKLISAFRRIFASKAQKIAQNGKFDMKFLWTLGVDIDFVDFDTILAHHLIDENIPLNLEFLANFYLGWERWDKELKSIVTKKSMGYDVIPDDTLWKYNAHDPDATLRLKHKFEEQIPDEDYDGDTPTAGKAFRQIVLPLQRTLMHMEMCGVYVDRDKLESNSILFGNRLDEVEQSIYKACGREFKLGSTQQLAKVLFGEPRWFLPRSAFDTRPKDGKWVFEMPGLGIPSTEMSDAGNPTTRKDALADHVKKLRLEGELPSWKIDVLENIVRYRNIRHWKNTFIDGADGTKGIKRFVREDDRIYPNYVQFGTDTGRIACREPNLQNIPRDNDLRSQFCSPEGWSFVECDYSQVENRVIAILSGAGKLLHAMSEGLDIHKNAATIFFRVPYEEVTKDQRDHAKFVTHGLNYGRTIPSIAAEHGMSIEDTSKYVQNYFELAPEQADWMLKQMNKVRQGVPIRNAFGRERHLPKDSKGHEQRQALNFPVQSSAADLISAATIRLYDRFKAEGLWWNSVKMTMSLHDALYFEVKDDMLEEVAGIIVEEMERPVPEMGLYKFPVELSAGKCWKDPNGKVLHKGVGGYDK